MYQANQSLETRLNANSELGFGILREGTSFSEHILIQVGLQGKALHGLGVRYRRFPVGLEDGVDGMNDAVLSDDVGGIRRSAGMIVELTNEGFVDVKFAELTLAGEGVAAEGFEGSRQLVREEILRDDVRLDDLFGDHTVVLLHGTVGRGKDREGSVPPENFGAFGLVNRVEEPVEVIVLLDVSLLLVFQPREVAPADAGTLEGAQGAQNVIGTEIGRQLVEVRGGVEGRHVQGRAGRRSCRGLLGDMEGRGRACGCQGKSDDKELHGGATMVFFTREYAGIWNN